ncbi:MAG: ligase, partial [Burkholderiales bacterium]|nr:ligase [Burkholderiales bacterium]
MLGCSQRRLRDGIEQRCGGRAELVLRESGGGAVLTGPWLVGASVVLPPAHRWVAAGPIDSYRHLGQLQVGALDEVGVPARALPPPDVARAEAASAGVPWACFGRLSPWEVVDPQGRKLVGLAQRRCRHGVLLVAGTLVGTADWALLCDLMGQPGDESLLRRRTVSCNETAGRRIEPQRFAAVLTRWLDRG